MLQYVCDNCGAIKGENDVWILGFAADRLGLRAARREVKISPTWDENRAVQWFAIHMCSELCRDQYLAALFGEVPSGATDIIESRLIHDEPISIAPKAKRTVKKTVHVKRRKAS